MKSILSFILLCLSMSLYGQAGTECSANAGPDRFICYNEPMILVAPESPYENNPPNIQWTQISGPPVTLATPNDYTTVVNGGPNWNVGDVFTFQVCWDCKDLDGDGTNDRPCDQVTITVTGEPTEPQITELDGNQDGHIKVCSTALMSVNAPAPGEQVYVDIAPSDGLTTWSISNGTLQVNRLDTGNKFEQGECDYTVTYYITTGSKELGGCVKKTSVDVTFVKPYDPDGDGTIEGYISPECPTCTNTLYLYGDRPGCGGEGKWEVINGPNGYTVNPFYENLSIGDAGVTLSLPGPYTFRYTVNNIDPCDDSEFTISCTVYQIGDGYLNSFYRKFCGNVAPADVYGPFTFNNIPNSIYQWTVIQNGAGVVIANPNSNSSIITLNNDIDLSGQSMIIKVTSTKYFLDPDCDAGNATPTEITLPYTDPIANLNFIEELEESLEGTGRCIRTCVATGYIYFNGVPVAKANADAFYFLCSNGNQYIGPLNQYYTVSGTDYFTQISLVSGGGPVTPSGPIYSNTPLTLNGFGDYVFRVDFISFDYEVSPPATCTTTVYLKFVVRGPEAVSAGTDLEKCYNELIGLSGNDPYNGDALGTWSLDYCSVPGGCTVAFSDPHDPSTIVYPSGIQFSDLPVTLRLKWEFASEGATCELSDIVEVVIKDCTLPCDDLDLHVVTECSEGQITLTVVDDNNFPVSSAYDVDWVLNTTPPVNISGNPVTIPYTPPPFNYDVEVSLVIDDEKVCSIPLSGNAGCTPPPSGCDISVIESCDECGNVVITAVFTGTTIPVTPTNYEHEFYWWVYGDGIDDTSGASHYDENPITVHKDACYKLIYETWDYPTGVPHVPGYGELCRWEMPKRCVEIECPGPCANFPNFYVAACGDDRDVTLGLTFPANCYSSCYGTWMTLGVFYADGLNANQPVDPDDYNITWENNTHGTYVTGTLQNINRIKITSLDGCCVWEDSFSPSFMCTCEMSGIYCEQPIVKYCTEGGVTYIPGIPRIVWSNVPGATEYLLEIDFDNIGEEGCCSRPSGAGIEYRTVSSSPWEIPVGWNCFTIRVKALNPNGICRETEWSAPFTYCAGTCSPVIIVCGCCHGRDAENTNLPTLVMSEEDMKAYLEKNNSSVNYPTLEGALGSMGISKTAEAASFSVFPNPASHLLVVRPKGFAEGTFRVQMHDMLQRETYNAEFNGGADGSVDVSNLPKGIYLLTVRGTNGTLLHSEKVNVIK